MSRLLPPPAVRAVVVFRFNREISAEAWSRLTAFVRAAREAPGNIEFELMADVEQPEYFCTVEKWSSMAVLERHIQSSYFKEFVSFLAANTTIRQVRKLRYLPMS